MRPASAATFSDPPESLLRRRTTALALVVGAHVLLVFMLLRLAPPPAPSAPPVTTFELIPDPEARTETVAKPKRERQQPAPRAAVQPLPPPPVDLPYKIDGLITLTREDYAASDVARLPTHRETPGDQAATASAQAAATGPNGERLYNADWYRRPTDAELGYYLPASVPRPGWAEIACQTVDDYRVDHCVALGQSTPGVALAAAIREAAWQFRVWPPRLGGRPLGGAWVRIRIDFTEVRAN